MNLMLDFFKQCDQYYCGFDISQIDTIREMYSGWFWGWSAEAWKLLWVEMYAVVLPIVAMGFIIVSLIKGIVFNGMGQIEVARVYYGRAFGAWGIIFLLAWPLMPVWMSGVFGRIGLVIYDYFGQEIMMFLTNVFVNYFTIGGFFILILSN